LAASDRFEEAVKCQQNAIAISQQKGESNAVAQMQERLALYRGRHSFVEE
jgi:hypothetical protein